LLETSDWVSRLVPPAGHRRLRPPRADRFLAFRRHWLDDHCQVFIGIAKRALAREDSRVIRCMHAHRLGQLVERNLIFFQPLGIRLACRESLLFLLVLDYSALSRYHRKPLLTR